MTPTELHAYIVVRWTEHRALAQEAALGGRWYSISDLVRSHHDGGAGLPDFDAPHIAANDPAHVTAVCDAALRRLARHAPTEDHAESTGLPACRWCTDEDADVPWPCPEVLDDATPWTHRDDFPRELRETQ